MSKFRNIKPKETTVHLDQYVDQSTGEVLESKGERFVRKEKVDLITVTSKNFVVLDVEVIQVLAEIVNDADLAKVLKMGLTTTTPLNILTNSNMRFHSNETLQKYLKIKSESMFIKMIKRLMKAGVLYQIKGNIQGSVRVIYMMNPLLSRKRKTFDPKVKEVFKSFDKEIQKLSK
tara:strand:+ start:153 stop:677 length:525 start_codon:yes stop_codon:yes gene_type:complete